MVREAYDFLDEKRLLLAAELLRQLAAYDHLRQELELLRQQAVSALVRAVAQHGLQGLSQSILPLLSRAARFETETRNFMGVMLADYTPAAGRMTVRRVYCSLSLVRGSCLPAGVSQTAGGEQPAGRYIRQPVSPAGGIPSDGTPGTGA